ncbi:LptF/LptG family permease [Sulfurimonas aquatica]|uniref:LptF/LptG family permease n=1 Tax=Sulfurimonas aquatica TaxID=2672570 RepID=A0A975GD80_9BACT|nr:LptF/LptG family permease [Sulfurimonas aquatica]QSZ42456.1 LptF/LptG family permease [Sulfurimonas aquatica]
MLAFKYVAFHYLKYFFIILGALVMFLVGFDYMGNTDGLSKSANLLLIYLVYKSFFAIDMLLPIALVFAMISTKIFLIRSNALVSFFSLGYSRVDILRPFVVVSTSIIVIFISLHSWSSFARADEFSNNIKKNSQYLSPTRDLFFTYKGQYVYFSKMLPLQEKAEGIRVFSIKNNSLKEVVVASSAVYRDEYWLIKEADVITKPDELSFTSNGIKISKSNDLKILEGFRPKILDQVYEGKVNFTIKNAIDAIILLNGQNINTSSIKGALYKIFIYPFFVPFLIIIIFFFVPISVRFLNVSLFSFGAILSTLLVWGILFMLIELSNTKTIPSELGVIAPIFLLFILAALQWRKYRTAT